MILWLAPAAFAAFALLAGPLIAHLLARRNARRVIFPAAHFVPPAQAAAIRLRRPADLALLIVRLAILSAAVLAAAQPLFVTRWNLSAWNARISRVVIVDTTGADRGQHSSAVIDGLAAREAVSAYVTQGIDTADLREGLQRAANWLAFRPPSRGEVVVVSDFRRGALDRDSFEVLPRDTGIRFIRWRSLPSEQTTTLKPIEGWRGGRWQATATVDKDGIRTDWASLGRGQKEDQSWLTVLAAPADAGAAARAKTAAASFGVAPGEASHRCRVVFTGGDEAAGEPIRTPWMARAALVLRDSDLLRQADVAVAAEERGGALIVRAPVSGSSAAAPAVVRAVMLAMRPAVIGGRELETAAIPDTDLAAWRRDPAAVTTSDMRRRWQLTDTDGRAFWALALVLLGIESWMRRSRRRVVAQEAHASAA